MTVDTTVKKQLMCGNDAMSEAAIIAGCRCYFGYPITPQNEVTAYMSKRMPQVGGTFLQSESELSAINMVFGAAAVGARAMTSSSSPGISLKQEGISYLCGCELPAVIANVTRGGPGLGNIGPSQADYYQSTRGGGHGDYRTIVLAPSSVQETVDLTVQAFDLAQKYRMPVLILSDGILGQMMEPVEFPEPREIDDGDREWTLTGCRGRAPRLIRSLYLDVSVLEEHNRKLQRKYDLIAENELRFEQYETADAELVLTAFGTSARLCRAAVKQCRSQGMKAGLFQPLTLWPFPSEELVQTAPKAKKFLAVEMNMGQMVDDVKLAVNGRVPVEFYGRCGGVLMTVSEIVDKVKEIY